MKSEVMTSPIYDKGLADLVWSRKHTKTHNKSLFLWDFKQKKNAVLRGVHALSYTFW